MSQLLCDWLAHDTEPRVSLGPKNGTWAWWESVPSL